MKTSARLGSLLRPYRWTILFCVFLSLCTSSALLAIPVAVKQLLGLALGDERVASEVPLELLLAGVVLVLPLSTFGLTYSMARIAHRVSADLRLSYARALLRAPLALHRSRNIGEMLDRLGAAVRDIEQFLETGLMGALGTTVLTGGALTMMFMLSWRLALIVVVSVPLIGVCLRPLHVRVGRAVSETAAAAARLTARIHDALVGIEVVKAFDAERLEMERLARQQDDLQRLQRHGSRLASLMEPIMLTTSVAAVVGVVIYSGHLLADGALQPESLVAFILYASILIPQSRSITPMILNWQQLGVGLRRVHEIADTDPETPPAGGVALPRPVRGEIRFERVRHAYAEREHALRDVSFHVTARDAMAIVGASGAGKSTLFNLLLKLYEPVGGRISIDGMDLGGLDGSSVRRAIAIVPQDIVLFDGTILENVRYGAPGAPERQVREACRTARAEHFIESLPAGYATRVGGRGLKLSGGQRQRIAIARALLKDAPILLLDEATSLLDTQTEHELHDAMEAAMRGRTTLIIAHRLATVVHLPRIVVMDGGRIVAEGSHEYLLARSELYRKLIATQLITDGQQAVTRVDSR